MDVFFWGGSLNIAEVSLGRNVGVVVFNSQEQGYSSTTRVAIFFYNVGVFTLEQEVRFTVALKGAEGTVRGVSETNPVNGSLAQLAAYNV